MIRTLCEQEYMDAYNFVDACMHEEKDASLSDAIKQSILSYFEKHVQEYGYLASFNTTMNGILVYEKDSFHIVFLLVKKEDRHKDIGSSLLDVFKETAQRLNISRITVNSYAQDAFYLANGFEKEGETNLSAGIPVSEMEYLCDKNILGKKVTVIVDRPYGSIHLTLQDVVYPYNSGYVLNQTMMEDAEFQDAYIVGVEEPIEKFTGYVIGIVYHKDAVTSKWIVAPAGMNINKDAIIQLLAIEEQFYDTRFIWSE